MAALWEMRNAIFRGELSGAGGTARFQLTAGAVDAVDAVNIANLAVTFEYVVGYWEVVPTLTAFAPLSVVVPDDGVLLEILAPNHNIGYEWELWVDGVVQTKHNQRGSTSWYCSPPIWYVYVPTARTVVLTLANHSLTSQGHYGFLIARYIRLTGTDNL